MLIPDFFSWWIFCLEFWQLAGSSFPFMQSSYQARVNEREDIVQKNISALVLLTTHNMLSLFFPLISNLNFTLSLTFSLPYQRKLSTDTQKNLYSYYFVPSDLILTQTENWEFYRSIFIVSLVCLCKSLFLEDDNLPSKQHHHIGWHPHHLRWHLGCATTM